MFELGNIIFFVLGGTIGFVLACILAAGARAELIQKYQRLLSKAHADHHGFRTDERKPIVVPSGSDAYTGSDG